VDECAVVARQAEEAADRARRTWEDARVVAGRWRIGKWRWPKRNAWRLMPGCQGPQTLG
jgi:hypothetical protein